MGIYEEEPGRGMEGERGSIRSNANYKVVLLKPPTGSEYRTEQRAFTASIATCRGVKRLH